MKNRIRKATRHVNQNEGLIFEKSSAGKAAWKLPPLDVPEVDTSQLLGSSERKDLGNMPEVSEIEIIRHFTRLSTWNYAIDLGMYPLGSCTMKYNPRVNEAVARVEGIANGHPYQPEIISQGALRVSETLSECLIEITGMDAITMQPRSWCARRDDRTAHGARLPPCRGTRAEKSSDTGFSPWNQSRNRRHGRLLG